LVVVSWIARQWGLQLICRNRDPSKPVENPEKYPDEVTKNQKIQKVTTFSLLTDNIQFLYIFLFLTNYQKS
jgi:hypothetical protein